MSRGQDTSAPKPGHHPVAEALVRAANRCFADHGFEAAGVGMIADLAKAAPDLVAVHFGNKEGLWLACVDLQAETLALRISALNALAQDCRTPLRERLELAIGLTAAYYDRNPDLRGFIARASMEPAPHGQIVSERLLKPLYEAARPLIQQGIDAGIIPIRDPALVFVIIHSALGQPDWVASALATLAPERVTDNTAGQVGEAMAQLLLSEDGKGHDHAC